MLKIKKYKVISTYKRYYLAVDELGIKECFNKALYKPDEEGYITKNIENYHNDSESMKRQPTRENIMINSLFFL